VTTIEWTDRTWNPTTGCSKVSPGCDHCYAETLSLRFGWSKKPWTPENAAENVVLHPERLDKPKTWRNPSMVFVNSMSDLFHEEVPDDYIGRVFWVMEHCPQHTFQVLTKRPTRMAAWCREHRPEPLPNVWLGTSIESWRFNHRAKALRTAPAAVRFISAEPLLDTLYPRDHEDRWLDLTGIDWLIVGGESGAKARPMHPEWARELRREATGHGTAFFFKQWGRFAPVIGHLDAKRGLHAFTPEGFEPFWGNRHGSVTTWDTPAVTGYGDPIMQATSKKDAGRELDGREWSEYPPLVTELVA
jgi:protein gp37